MLYNERLLYINENNESINVGYDFELIPVSGGFEDSVDNELNTTKFALQDGSTFVSSSLSDRVISVTFTYAIKNALAIEKEVMRVCNPALEGTLYKINSFGEKFIKVRLSSVPQVKRELGRGEITLDFKACVPFYQTTDVTVLMIKQTPMTRFPMFWATPEQRIFGVYIDVENTVIQNKGDVDTGFTVTFKARGDVVNPSLINNATGEMIRLNMTMTQGDEVQIINMPFAKQVLVNGVKKFSALDRVNTTFFNIKVGRNSFKVEADENATNLSVMIRYAPKFLT